MGKQGAADYQRQNVKQDLEDLLKFDRVACSEAEASEYAQVRVSPGLQGRSKLGLLSHVDS